MERVLTVRIAVDPSDAHVEARVLKLSNELQQQFSLPACHVPLPSTARPGETFPAAPCIAWPSSEKSFAARLHA